MACRQVDARLVHYSTDYVFDGTKGTPYVETDTPHPLGAYAVSKLAGELYAQAYLDNPLVIRTSGCFRPAGVFTAAWQLRRTHAAAGEEREPDPGRPRSRRLSDVRPRDGRSNSRHG